MKENANMMINQHLLWKQLSAIPIDLVVEMSMQQIAANT